jgi:hypothetical protein
MATLTLHEGQAVTAGVNSATVNKILHVPNNTEHVIICNKSPWVYVVSVRGQVCEQLQTSIGIVHLFSPF